MERISTRRATGVGVGVIVGVGVSVGVGLGVSVGVRVGVSVDVGVAVGPNKGSPLVETWQASKSNTMKIEKTSFRVLLKDTVIPYYGQVGQASSLTVIQNVAG